jgi:hypothetical protein
VSLFFETDSANDLIDAVTALVETAKEPHSLFYGNFFRELSFLQLNADAFAQRSIVTAVPVLAQQLDRAFILRC